jgi:hypothetical protein
MTTSLLPLLESIVVLNSKRSLPVPPIRTSAWALPVRVSCRRHRGQIAADAAGQPVDPDTAFKVFWKQVAKMSWEFIIEIGPVTNSLQNYPNREIVGGQNS